MYLPRVSSDEEIATLFTEPGMTELSALENPRPRKASGLGKVDERGAV